MEKITKVKLPFDMKNEVPSKDYGFSGLRIWFVLKGELGAVQFMASFPVYLQSAHDYWKDKGLNRAGRETKIEGWDVGYHARTPQFEGQEPMKDCEYLGCDCYYDGSSLRAERWGEIIFSTKGKAPEEVLWPMLEQEYIERFGELK